MSASPQTSPIRHRESFSLLADLTIPDRLSREYAPLTTNRTHGFDLAGSPGLPALGEISVSPERSRGHFLGQLLTSPALITSADLHAITRALESTLSAVKHGGGVPASPNAATHYAEYSWTRDSAMVALALKRDGKIEEAAEVLWGMLEFYGTGSQRSKFDYYHFSADPAGEYSRRATHPHAMARIGENGRLVEATLQWGHEQLDTIGWLLFLSFRLANEGAADLQRLNHRITSTVNPDNGIESETGKIDLTL